jgi:transposase-like protein
MRQKFVPEKEPATQVVKTIRRATRRHFSAEDKIRIVLEGLRGEDSIAELFRHEGIVQTFITAGGKTFLEGGKSDWLAIRPGPRRRTRSRTCVVRPARLLRCGILIPPMSARALGPASQITPRHGRFTPDCRLIAEPLTPHARRAG